MTGGQDSLDYPFHRVGVPHDVSAFDAKKMHAVVGQGPPGLGPCPRNDGITCAKDCVNRGSSLRCMVPSFSTTCACGPKRTVRLPCSSHQGAHGVVLGVVQCEVFEMRRNDSHSAQASDPRTHGACVSVGPSPCGAAQSRLDGETVHGVFSEPVWREQDHAAPRVGVPFEEGQGDAPAERISKQRSAEALARLRDQGIHPGIQCALEELRLEHRR